ncbi:cation diffusion facilitator family transporter [Acidiphilium acidophilum]|jgi:cobalt-zinc-cadmium efflux system protein|uniref:Cation diffusion facilitator family transporter n=1 Tax=Acidiphilium acidophilum TaxID=76588 RepID=A0AAW9DN30_ACIAO|nr:cation diffusion facilitator family transporter [Acidiphilium acidophilum]MDX5929600.1 cation diffusion facilitator family transporter [Acidiphilium acidophilum]
MAEHDHHHDHDHDHEHEHGHHDHHGHSHGLGGHSHAPASFGRAFVIGIGLNTTYVVIEAFWGLAVHSTALLADASHNLGDVLGLAGAWLASWLSQRVPNTSYTYGLRRSSILAALANAIILLIVTGGIAWEAIQRLIHPVPTGGRVIMLVAIAGVFVNGVTAWLFMSGRKGDLNIRAAFLHMAADASLALGVAIAGAIIMTTGWVRLDPTVSLGISIVIVIGTWSLLRDSVALALDGVPRGIDQRAVEAYLRALPGVSDIHDLHIWGLSTTETALTVHLACDAAEIDATLERLPGEVRKRFGIGHATVQMETPETAERCELRSADVV